MIPTLEIVSSWEVQDGIAWPLGTKRPRNGAYQCTTCHERGHTSKTCGRTDEERKAMREANRKGNPSNNAYAIRKATGLCVRCGERAPDHDAVSCRRCLDMVNARRVSL
jgi:hypothetical protein